MSNAVQSAQDLLGSELLTSDPDTLLVRPPIDLLTAVVQSMNPEYQGGAVRALTSEGVLYQLSEQPLFASKANALIEEGRLDLCEASPDRDVPLCVSGDSVFISPADGKYIRVSESDVTDGTDRLVDFYDDLFVAEATHTFDVPEYDTIQHTLGDATTLDLRDDMLEALDAISVYGRRRPANATRLLLLVGAKHDRFQSELAEWADDLGLVAPTTFSRNRQTLRDHGFVSTEKVRMGLGSPRLKLSLSLTRDSSLSNLVETLENSL